MSILTHESIGHRAGSGLYSRLAGVGAVLHAWRQRHEARLELSRWSDRQLHDIGRCREDIASELAKPFWQA